MKKVWFITGSSKGLGKNLVEAVLAKGDYVVATARNPQQLNDLVENIRNRFLRWNWMFRTKNRFIQQ